MKHVKNDTHHLTQHVTREVVCVSHSAPSVKLVCKGPEILPDLRHSCLPGKCIYELKTYQSKSVFFHLSLKT